MIRCADASGADGVILSAESVDPHNPKTVRADRRQPVPSADHDRTEVSDAVVAALRAAGIRSWRPTAPATIDLVGRPGSWPSPTPWLFGNEAHGLPDDLAPLADRRVSVPILGPAESLNLSTAAALCLYESGPALAFRGLRRSVAEALHVPAARATALHPQ